MTGCHVGDPVGGALVDLHLEHGEIGADDEAVLGLGPQVEVPVAAQHSMIERDAQPEIGPGPHERLAAVAGHRGRPQVEAHHEVEDLVDESLIVAGELQTSPTVAEVERLLVGKHDPALLGDPVDALLDLHRDRAVGGEFAERLAVAADPQLAPELQPFDLLAVEAQLGSVVVDAPHPVAARTGVGVGFHAPGELLADRLQLRTGHEVLQLEAVEGVEGAGGAQAVAGVLLGRCRSRHRRPAGGLSGADGEHCLSSSARGLRYPAILRRRRPRRVPLSRQSSLLRPRYGAGRNGARRGRAHSPGTSIPLS